MRDSEYKYLSNSVYEVDTKKVSRSWKEGDTLDLGKKEIHLKEVNPITTSKV